MDGLDPRTAAWFEGRKHQLDNRVVLAAGPMGATSDLEERPSGTSCVRLVFNYERRRATGPPHVRGTVVAADAYCGAVPFVAISYKVRAWMGRWFPSYVRLDGQACPAGWVLALAPDAPASALPGRAAVDALASITSPKWAPRGRRSEITGDRAPDQILATAKRSGRGIRVSFERDSLYVDFGATRPGWDRSAQIQLVEYLANRLPPAPSADKTPKRPPPPSQPLPPPPPPEVWPS